jgi:hypothetical protein
MSDDADVAEVFDSSGHNFDRTATNKSSIIAKNYGNIRCLTKGMPSGKINKQIHYFYFST